MWKTISATAIAVLLTFGMIRVFAGPIPYVNSGQLAIPATGGDLNALISQINSNVVTGSGAALTVASNPLSPAPVDGVVVTGGQPSASGTTGSVTIGTAGQDPNVNLVLATQGAGLIQFAGTSTWVPAAGLAPCPGYVNGGKNPVGVSPVVTGYWVWQDYLGRTHSTPNC